MPFNIATRRQYDLDIITLQDDAAGARVDIVPAIGAMLHAFIIMHNGQPLNLIDSYESLQHWQEQLPRGFKGVKLSPYAGRIPGGTYEWEGQPYRISKTVAPGQAIHGLLYDAAFEVLEQQAGNDHATLLLRHSYPGTDPGYPFAYDCTVQYRLLPGLRLETSTTVLNRAGRAIPVTDGWHPYFTTGAPVDQLELRIAPGRLVEFSDQLVPTGRLLPFDGFAQAKKLAGVQLDNSFLPDFTQAQPLCTLHDPVQHITLAFYPDNSYPVLQIYIPPHRNSIAIEHLSAPPNAFNNGMSLSRLEPGAQLTFTTGLQVWLA